MFRRDDYVKLQGYYKTLAAELSGYNNSCAKPQLSSLSCARTKDCTIAAVLVSIRHPILHLDAQCFTEMAKFHVYPQSICGNPQYNHFLSDGHPNSKLYPGLGGLLPILFGQIFCK